MKGLMIFVVLLLSGAPSFAQSDCPNASLKLFNEKTELASQGGALPSEIMLVLQDNPECPSKTKYEIVSAKLYMVRDNRPYGSEEISGPQVNMSYWADKYQPGDRIVIKITSANTVSEEGERQPYTASTVISWRLK